MIKSKVCTKCKKRKHYKKFHKRKNRHDALYSWCIQCMQNYYKQWRKTKFGRKYMQDYTHNYYLKMKFGITAGQYAVMLKKQGGVCAICKQKENHGKPNKHRKSQRLAVDHDSKTKQVRGLLCSQCNRHLLGSLKGKQELFVLRNAVKYLSEYKKKYKER